MKSSLAVISSLLLIFSGIALADTSMDRILSALEKGQVTDAQAADFLVISIRDQDNLPATYLEGTDAVPCGTPAILEAYRLAGEFDSPLADRPTLSGPEYTFNSPAGFFKIHWTDSGEDAVNLTYANTIAIAADSSWQVQCDEMNFITPPPDNGVGGDDLYDIYICYLGGGVLGYTSPSGEYHPPDSTQACTASHIVMGSNISGIGQRVCTVAHEFQHAVQFSYSYEEPTWFMENCAVWMEEMVYPDVNDYIAYISYGENALRTPWMDIRSGSMYWYGAFTWPWMMWDKWNYQAVREVWEICSAVAGLNMLPAHEEMFSNHGTNFESFFMQYGLWRWFTAANWFTGCGLYDEECTLWVPGPRVLPWHIVTTLPFSGDQTAVYPPETYGIHWITVDLSSYQDQWILMEFDGRDGFEWNLGVIMQSDAGDFSFNWYNGDAATGEVTVSIGADGWDSAIFFPAFMSSSSLDHLYTFDLSATTGIEGSPENRDILDLNVSSNPIQAGGFVTFDLPSDGNARICVYDMSGRMAASLLDSEMQAGSHTLQFEGSDLSEGTYFIMLFANDQVSGQKVVLTR